MSATPTTTDKGAPQESDDNEESSQSSASLAAIDLDLERTFSNLSSAAGARSQAKILLNRFVEEHPAVGYTQGMNYVATCLILRHTRGGHCAQEVAYQQFVSIMARLSGLWSDGLPLLEPAIDCYLKCCKKYLPRLYARLAYLKVDPLAYLPTGWLSLFSKWLPMDCVLLVLDLVAGHGLSDLLAVTLAIFHQYQDVMVQMNSMHQVLEFLNRDMQLQPMKPDKLISCTTMVWLPRVQKTVGADLERAVGTTEAFSTRQSSNAPAASARRTINDSEFSEAVSTGCPTEQPARTATASPDPLLSPREADKGVAIASSEGPEMLANGKAMAEERRCQSGSSADGGAKSTEEMVRLKVELSEKDATILSLRQEIAILKEERNDAIEMQMRCVQAKDELQRDLLDEIAQLRNRLGDE